MKHSEFFKLCLDCNEMPISVRAKRCASCRRERKNQYLREYWRLKKLAAMTKASK